MAMSQSASQRVLSNAPAVVLEGESVNRRIP